MVEETFTKLHTRVEFDIGCCDLTDNQTLLVIDEKCTVTLITLFAY